MRSTQENEFANIRVGWNINWCRPLYVRASILVPSLVFILFCHQDFDFALKSPRIIEKSGLKELMTWNIFSKPERKLSNLELIWLGDLYKTVM